MPVGTILEIKIDPNPSSLARHEKTLIDGQALLGREIRTRLRLARRQLVVQTIGLRLLLERLSQDADRAIRVRRAVESQVTHGAPPKRRRRKTA